MIDYNILIDRFLKITDVISNPNEGYKYEAINHFQNNWMIDASDFHQMFREAFAKRGNLFYQNSWGFIDKCAEHFPEITRTMFRDLYDENVDLEIRISNFQNKADELLDQLKSQLNRDNLNAQQDERTISVYLGFRYPEKYIFYMFSFYGRLAVEFKIIGDFREKKNYSRLLSLLPDFRNTVKEREDFVERYRSFYPAPGWDDTNLMIQNILYVGYRDDLDGVYDGSLLHFSKNDLESYYHFLDKIIDRFNLHKKDYRLVFNQSEKQLNFTVGQKYVWCLKAKNKVNKYRAIANEKFGQSVEIFNSETNKFLNDTDDFDLINNNFDLIASAISNELEKTKKSGYYKFNSAFFERMAFDVEFRNLILDKLMQGTNNKSINYWIFQCNPKNYLLSAALRDNAINSWKVNSHREKFKIGDKAIIWLTGNYSGVYALAKIVSLPSQDVEDDLKYYKVQPTKDEYRVSIEIEFNCYNNPILKTELEKHWWFSEMNVGLQGTNFKSSEEEYNNILNLISNTNQIRSSVDMKYPLNQILYGPPGTGKTYSMQKNYFPQFSIEESSLTKESYIEGIVADLNWWQVITVALLDIVSGKVRNIYEHEIVQMKERLSSSKTVMPTIWGQLQSHTVLHCEYVKVEKRSEPLYFIKDEKSNWSIDMDTLKNTYPEAEELLSKIKDFKPQAGKLIKNYEFVTFHQSFSYEDFIEGIKPKLDEGDNELSFEIKDGVFKKICIKAENDSENNYAIFIDEINRGNVSAIFGELITLIESDKRIGRKNELKVKLPYSKKEFGVPSNLYIIGTMNTADRSVEALDTALRRRFSFVEMMPDVSIVEKENFNENYPRAEVMQKINDRIELLLDRNYTLGHSYFLKEDFKASFKNEIIPLLQEYFYNDFGKIGLILGRGFVREKEISKSNQKNIFADFVTRNDIEIVKSYELIPFEEVEFEAALELLLV